MPGVGHELLDLLALFRGDINKLNPHHQADSLDTQGPREAGHDDDVFVFVSDLDGECRHHRPAPEPLLCDQRTAVRQVEHRAEAAGHAGQCETPATTLLVAFVAFERVATHILDVAAEHLVDSFVWITAARQAGLSNGRAFRLAQACEPA